MLLLTALLRSRIDNQKLCLAMPQVFKEIAAEAYLANGCGPEYEDLAKRRLAHIIFILNALNVALKAGQAPTCSRMDWYNRERYFLLLLLLYQL